MDAAPDRQARYLAHAIVGLAVGVLVTQLAGRKAGILIGLVSMAAHEVLDAPVATYLAEIGI